MAVEFKHRVLGNGLTVIAEADADAHSAAAGFFVRTGARDEPLALMGVSHFLEHMMFKGTEKVSADELNQRFDDMGARHNAYTSGEVTCFYAQVLPELMGDALGLLSHMMRPALRQDDFDTEKNVILEEIAMYRDNPFWVLYEEAMDRYFRPHGLGYRVLGTDESITALTRDQMAGYFNDRYAPDNMVLSLAGRVDFDRACEMAERECGDWAPTGARRDTAPPPTNAEEFTLEDEGVHRGYLIGLAPAPSADDERRYAAMVLGQLLGGDGNSRLHWALVEKGIAEEAQAGYDPHEGCGVFMVYAGGEPDRLGTIRGVINDEIDGLVDSMTETDLERIRNRIATMATVGGERPGDRMQRIGRLWAALQYHRSLEEELERINSVTLDNLRNLYAEMSPMPRLVGTLCPAG
ncbi:MAG: insulinase family protein [Phycisphaeraceae bacterium]|nr:MAG: insulinase family protein [Phycisphaeraceae bacterium]